ncbi:MAG: hypothetical protein K5739_06770 [Lachnospiraceae bacterium]|nr:hypothetical protein [Lachnospiraceae bacterium]
MRITNKIISNNSVTNINNNKVLEDKLNTQLATGSKVTRPSDDPVVAIRALRLRTNLNQVNQYYTKNIPDANSWLEVTETAINTVLSIVEDMQANCTKGAVGFDTTTDRDKVLQNLKALQEEVYSTGDADYAGRFVFGGYRTSTSVTFGKPTSDKPYKITEQLDRTAIDEITYVNVDKLNELTETNAESLGTTPQDISSSKVFRIRLAYDNIDKGDDVVPTLQYAPQADGTFQNMTVTKVSLNDPAQDPYQMATGNNVIFVPETGELLLGEDAYNTLMNTKDVGGTNVDEGEIRITYQKSNWEAKDLRPEHYFYCESKNEDGVDVYYNERYLEKTFDPAAGTDDANQFISYDVGFNQTVRVNTLAKELFSTSLARDIDDIVRSIEAVDAMEKNITSIKNKLAEDPNNQDLKDRLEAAEKANVYLNDKMQKLFEDGVGKMKEHHNLANNALTETGNRSARVELVSNRLSKQQTNFKSLSSENEDIDMAEVAVDLSSVELAYQAALMATGKISQTTLLNYL